MIDKRIAGLAAATLIACWSTAANAAFVLEREAEPTPQPVSSPGHRVAVGAAGGRNVDLSAKVDRLSKMNRQRIDLESRVTSRITQSGTPPAELQVLRGMGRDVTLEDALKQVLPAGWSAFSDQDLPGGPVDWDGNRSWPMVLHSVLTQYDMRAHIDWATSELMLFVPAPKVEVPTETVATIVPGASAPKVEIRPVSWTLTTDKTLRENLRGWASTAGWNLVWSATVGDTVVDYPVDANVAFEGELVGVNGAMAKVIAAYGDADRPLEIEFFKGNKVIEVRLHRVPDVKTGGTGAAGALPARAQVPLPPTKPVYVPATESASGG